MALVASVHTRRSARLVLALVTAAGCGSGDPAGPAAGDASSGDASIETLQAPEPEVGIAPGLFFTCGRLPSALTKCWGLNMYGMLGNGTTADSVMPVQVSSLAGAVAISANGYNACAVIPSGDVECWGDNTGGQLGETTLPLSAVPTRVPDVDRVVQVSVGTAFACALRSGGTVECWGANNTAQLGNGTLLGSPYYQGAASPVSGLTGAVAIAAGGNHACALLTSGTITCWGDNELGQLGPATHAMNSDVPVLVPGLSQVTAVSAGSGSSCALLRDSTVWCWGENARGELGQGTTSPQIVPAPVKVSSLQGATAISVGTEYACAVLSGHTATCWGSNQEGTLGNGTRTDSPVPVPVSNLSGVSGIAAGGVHACAQLADGTFACWGNNQHGQLGDGSMTRALTPVRVQL